MVSGKKKYIFIVAIAAAVVIVAISLSVRNSNIQSGKELYNELYNAGLFISDSYLDKAAAENYLSGMGYDPEDAINDINAYLRSIGEDPLAD